MRRRCRPARRPLPRRRTSHRRSARRYGRMLRGTRTTRSSAAARSRGHRGRTRVRRGAPRRSMCPPIRPGRTEAARYTPLAFAMQVGRDGAEADREAPRQLAQRRSSACQQRLGEQGQGIPPDDYRRTKKAPAVAGAYVRLVGGEGEERRRILLGSLLHRYRFRHTPRATYASSAGLWPRSAGFVPRRPRIRRPVHAEWPFRPDRRHPHPASALR